MSCCEIFFDLLCLILAKFVGAMRRSPRNTPTKNHGKRGDKPEIQCTRKFDLCLSQQPIEQLILTPQEASHNCPCFPKEPGQPIDTHTCSTLWEGLPESVDHQDSSA